LVQTASEKAEYLKEIQKINTSGKDLSRKAEKPQKIKSREN